MHKLFKGDAKMTKKVPFFLKIFIGLGFGVITGIFLVPRPDIAVSYFKPVGDIYLRLLKFIIGTVVFLTVTSGVSSMREVKTVGKVGIRAVVFYMFTTAVAVIIGLVCAMFFKPLFSIVKTDGISFESASDINFGENLINMFPDNFFGAFTGGNMLQILIAAVLFGIAIVSAKRAFEGVSIAEKVVLKVMDGILRLSPIGVFGLIVPVVAQTGINVLKNLLVVILCVYLAFLLHVLLVYAPLLYARKRVNFFKFVKEMLPVIAVAFSTASSVSTITLNLECSKKLGADNETADLVIPLGATVNMDGTGIYQGVCVVFIAACFGIELTALQCLILVASVTIASIGTAGVPGAGILMLAVALESVGLPSEGVALVAGVDRIFDMGRTAINVMGDAACAICISDKNKIAE